MTLDRYKPVGYGYGCYMEAHGDGMWTPYLAAIERIEALEAKLAKALEALEAFDTFDRLPLERKRPDIFEIKVRRKLLATFRELKGGTQ